MHNSDIENKIHKVNKKADDLIIKAARYKNTKNFNLRNQSYDSNNTEVNPFTEMVEGFLVSMRYKSFATSGFLSSLMSAPFGIFYVKSDAVFINTINRISDNFTKKIYTMLPLLGLASCTAFILFTPMLYFSHKNYENKVVELLKARKDYIIKEVDIKQDESMERNYGIDHCSITTSPEVAISLTNILKYEDFNRPLI